MVFADVLLPARHGISTIGFLAHMHAETLPNSAWHLSLLGCPGSYAPHIDNNIATRNRHWRGCLNRAEWYWRSTQFFLPDAKRRIHSSQVADKMVRPDAHATK